MSSTFDNVRTIVEVLLCIPYAYIIKVVALSKNDALKSPFYTFFVWTGLCAIVNVFAVALIWVVREILNLGPSFMFLLLIGNFLSHSFAMGHTIGKLYTSLHRLTLFYSRSRTDKWSKNIVRCATAFQMIVPLLLMAYIPFFPGSYQYKNTTNTWLFTPPKEISIAKLFGSVTYVIFLIVAISCNGLSMVYLYKYRTTIAGPEIRLLVYVVVIVVCHSLKCAHQFLWGLALERGDNDAHLFYSLSYAWVNDLTTFTPPILLLVLSDSARKEVFRSLFHSDLCIEPSATISSSSGLRIHPFTTDARRQ